MAAMQSRKVKVGTRKEALNARMESNVGALQRVESDIRAMAADNPIPEVMAYPG